MNHITPQSGIPNSLKRLPSQGCLHPLFRTMTAVSFGFRMRHPEMRKVLALSRERSVLMML